MKTIKLAVCFMDEDDKIISKRVIGTNWQIDMERSLREYFNIAVHDEIAAVLTETMKSQLTEENIKEMLKEIE